MHVDALCCIALMSMMSMMVDDVLCCCIALVFVMLWVIVMMVNDVLVVVLDHGVCPIRMGISLRSMPYVGPIHGVLGLAGGLDPTWVATPYARGG